VRRSRRGRRGAGGLVGGRRNRNRAGPSCACSGGGTSRTRSDLRQRGLAALGAPAERARPRSGAYGGLRSAPGLSVSAILTFAPVEDATLVPRPLTAMLSDPISQPRKTTIAGLPAWRYGDLATTRPLGMMNVTVVPTSAGTMALACVAPRSLWSVANDCAARVLRVTLDGARPLGWPGPTPTRRVASPRQRRPRERRRTPSQQSSELPRPTASWLWRRGASGRARSPARAARCDRPRPGSRPRSPGCADVRYGRARKFQRRPGGSATRSNAARSNGPSPSMSKIRSPAQPQSRSWTIPCVAP
jgi:hypothetical protein